MKKRTAIALAIFALAILFGAGAALITEGQDYLEPVAYDLGQTDSVGFCPKADPGCDRVLVEVANSCPEADPGCDRGP